MVNRGASFVNIINEAHEFLQLKGCDAANFPEWLSNRDLIRDWDRRHVYQACLGRLPEREIGVSDWPYSSRIECAKHVANCLLSREFRENIIKIVGSVRPDIRRTFFVHIPKTAGTSIRHYLDDNFNGLCWNTAYADNDYWLGYETELLGITPLEFMLRFVGQFYNGTELLVTGHKPISHWIDSRLIRTSDQVFSCVRHPREMVISGLSYVVGLVLSDIDRIDAVGWREITNYVEVQLEDGSLIKKIDVKSILRSDLFVAEFRNNITRFLSVDGTAEGAGYLTNLVNCHIITSETMEKFLQNLTGSDNEISFHNKSDFDAMSIIEEDDLSYIDYYLCSEDVKTLAIILNSSKRGNGKDQLVGDTCEELVD